MNKGIFLDRDGTLIVDRSYLADPDGVELIPGTREALLQARSLGYLLFLFSNQSGVGRGWFTMAEVRRVNARLDQLLGFEGSAFTEVCMATEPPEDPHVYRKPSPRFILEMTERYRLDRTISYMVGDRESDLVAAKNAGIQPVLVLSGQDSADLAAAHGVPVFPDLAAFVDSLK